MAFVRFLLMSIFLIDCSFTAINTIDRTDYGRVIVKSLIAKNSDVPIDMPNDILFDLNGDMYISNTGHCNILKLNVKGKMSVFAGKRGVCAYRDGPIKTALFNNVNGLAMDDGGNIYIADSGNRRIRKISKDGQVSAIAGDDKKLVNIHGGWDGPALSALFVAPDRVRIDKQGNLYIIDLGVVRKLLTDGNVVTIAGTYNDYVDENDFFKENITDIAISKNDEIYLSSAKNRVIKIDVAGSPSNLAGESGKYGNVDGEKPKLGLPMRVAVDMHGNSYVSDQNRLKKITKNGFVTSISFNTLLGKKLKSGGVFVVFDRNDVMHLVDVGGDEIYRIERHDLIDFHVFNF
ncbi:hypothetical protein [Iodobacter fluviatilis]|uniref:Gluconolactonase n=1 Tax=Iodobacter fluviatilis TaxID=537 RepID=A0A377Q1L7_9NEIS|nr:hypothetical protein [Iodobacter fluviatilis]TCU90057.1 NHL repeat-containing protein [Iodobacter fluviatilis]STQ89084.1 Gluconolactonase [Iodobacter fluviatilis]